jgi:hypothetical protein
VSSVTHTGRSKVSCEGNESDKCGKRLKSELNDGYSSDGEVTVVTAAESEMSECFPNKWEIVFEDSGESLAMITNRIGCS